MFGLHRRGGPLLRTDPEPGSLDGGQDFFFLFCDDDDDDAFSLPIIHYSSIHPSIHLSRSRSLRLASGAPFRHRIALRIRFFSYSLTLYLVRAASLRVVVAQCICIGCCDLKKKKGKQKRTTLPHRLSTLVLLPSTPRPSVFVTQNPVCVVQRQNQTNSKPPPFPLRNGIYDPENRRVEIKESLRREQQAAATTTTNSIPSRTTPSHPAFFFVIEGGLSLVIWTKRRGGANLRSAETTQTRSKHVGRSRAQR